MGGRRLCNQGAEGGVEGGAQVGGWLRRVCLIPCLGENKRDERKEIPVNEETLLLL